ncbi:stage III sporulation protein AC [Tepidibacillus infernus]|uniref:Stage III sporulation protein AC n=1 Tax=Tepidibacillus decaturensis TaxID=1413211 RepID=A0A135L2S2_9BACI|nr:MULTISPECIES: stage III sporulation protein AC [Tepidibacillus]KXG43281.1 stage III sporulation protein AC [Tepidibacillus decaturensis]GBF11027.1 stage III sporulation protein AC/AD protein family protein [Tepidibacillus sp. HK-1]
MTFDVNTLFTIAGIGIVIAMMHTIFKQMGKEDIAHWITVIGFIIILYMVATFLNDLFQEIKRVFLFQ